MTGGSLCQRTLHQTQSIVLFISGQVLHRWPSQFLQSHAGPQDSMPSQVHFLPGVQVIQHMGLSAPIEICKAP